MSPKQGDKKTMGGTKEKRNFDRDKPADDKRQI
jgi:hypothetical protein